MTGNMAPIVESASTWTVVTAVAACMAALAAIATAGAAILYTKYTKRLLAEATVSRLAASDPLVVVYTRPSSRGAPWPELVVRNTGRTPAYDVRFSTCSAILESWVGEDAAKRYTNRVNVLPGGEALVLDLVALRYSASRDDTVLRMTASYSRLPGDPERLTHESVVSPLPPLPFTLETSADPMRLVHFELKNLKTCSKGQKLFKKVKVGR